MIGFDKDLYLKKQYEHIKERIERFNNKLYLEFGGKLLDDFHASRVLPGFCSDAKLKLLMQFKDMAEVVFCINANDIEKNKIRADLGITYDLDLIRLIKKFKEIGLFVNSVVITQYKNQVSVDVYRKKLKSLGIKSHLHYPIDGYPGDINKIASDKGYGANDFVETTRPLVVVTAPGPCSGKLATCLSQLYHEYKRGHIAGYAKFETFPIWNLPLKHPVNLAYEAATADLKDVNMIDPYHLDAYNVTTVNYNRDVEAFPVVNTILRKITGECVYKSPTDMGVNMAGYAIIDDEVVREAAKQEIIRRYYKSLCDNKLGRVDMDTVERIQLIMQQIGISKEDRKVVQPALDKAKKTQKNTVSIQLQNGKIVTGKTSSVMHAAAAAVINAIKELSGISDKIMLLAPSVIEPIMKMKREILTSENLGTLNLEEVLLALSICALTNPTVDVAMEKIKELRGAEAHSTNMLKFADENIFRKLNINLTCEANF